MSDILRRTLAPAGVFIAAGAFAAAAHGAYPGVNGRVAYEVTEGSRELTANGPQRNYDDDHADLYTSDAAGGDVKLLVPGLDDENDETAHDPAISPDGKLVAYVRSGYVGDQWVDRVHVIGIDGTGDRELIPGNDGMSAPTWSPDGTRIAFVHEPETRAAAVENQSGYNELWVTNADGTGTPSEIVIDDHDLGEDVYNPQWSPNGKWIAFDDDDDVLLVPAGGGGSERLDRSAPDRYPNWAPDSSALVFETYVENRTTIRDVVVDAGGSFGASSTVVGWEQSSDPRRPAYSPDGLKIVYSDYPQQDSGLSVKAFGARRLMTVDAAGATDPQVFLENDDNAQAPDWGPVPPAATPAVVPSKPPVVTVGGVKGDSARRCGSRRNFTIRLRPRGEKLALARVLVNGKRAKVKPGKRWTAVVDLRSLPRKRFKVDITVWTKSGRRYHEVRRYWTCTAAIPPKKR
jgi:hypothetical protein